eukprot:2555069-Rhodomonas_salina.1
MKQRGGRGREQRREEGQREGRREGKGGGKRREEEQREGRRGKESRTSLEGEAVVWGLGVEFEGVVGEEERRVECRQRHRGPDLGRYAILVPNREMHRHEVSASLRQYHTPGATSHSEAVPRAHSGFMAHVRSTAREERRGGLTGAEGVTWRMTLRIGGYLCAARPSSVPDIDTKRIGAGKKGITR